jgi:hypothetical protein
LFGEIFLCRFPFTSGVLSKQRPALDLFDLGLDVLICRITSAAASGPLDIPISSWRPAGLAKPSIARLNRLVTSEKSLLTRRLRNLTPADAAAIRAAWNHHMRL